MAGSSVVASNQFAALGTGLTLVATNVASGSAITVKFVNVATSGAPGLDNIAVGAFAVGAPPAIVQQPAQKTAMLPGTTAALSVSALGVPPLAYQWRTSGVALADATNASLTVTAWQTNYTVVVTAPNGASVTSQVARVLDTVVNGDFGDLAGLTANGDWYGGVPVGWSLTSGSSGYTVQASMGLTPPTFNLDGKTLVQSLGTLTNVSDVVVSFVLSQPFNAVATTADAFLMNGSSVLASGRYAFTAQGQSVAATLAATNVPAGAALSVKFAEVTGGAPGLDNVIAAVFATNAPPLVIGQPKAKNAMPDGTRVTLSAAALGVPPLSYQWLTNGVALAGATNAALTVTQACDYRVAVTAPNGASATSAVAEVVGSLVNGDFSDLSGMTPTVSGWYRGLPPGWSSTDHPDGGSFAVATEGTSGGATPPTCNPSSLNRLQQESGTLLRTSHVALRFELPFGYNNQTWATLRASLLNAATGATLATGDFGVGATHTLKALNVPAGTPLKVELQSLNGTTPALDNVSVTVTRPGLLVMVN